MLPSAEADLVRRDPAVPGLGVVLDPDAFVAELRRAAPQADVRAAAISYVRYKPRSYCRVAYRLNLAGAELDLDVRACRPDDLVRHCGEDDHATVSAPLGRLVMEQAGVVVFAFPNDCKLRALPHLADATERARVLRELLPGQPDLWPGELHCLRYRPERRYVAALVAGGKPRAIVKAYTRKGYCRSEHNARAFQSRDLLRVARLIGSSDHHRLLAFEWLPGRRLMELCAAPQFDGEAVARTGAALAALHARDPGGLARWTRDAEKEDLLSLASELGCICPSLARRAEVLAGQLAERLTAAPAQRSPLHGDFSANQVLVSDRGVAIIDLDWACYGDPADDLGNCVAQAERYALRGELPPGRVESIQRSLFQGYARATNRTLPARVGLYTAVGLFRRARFPFRMREPDWPQRTEALLGRAEALAGN